MLSHQARAGNPLAMAKRRVANSNRWNRHPITTGSPDRSIGGGASLIDRSPSGGVSLTAISESGESIDESVGGGVSITDRSVGGGVALTAVSELDESTQVPSDPGTPEKKDKKLVTPPSVAVNSKLKADAKPFVPSSDSPTSVKSGSVETSTTQAATIQPVKIETEKYSNEEVCFSNSFSLCLTLFVWG
jgi:hypothetical protein